MAQASGLNTNQPPQIAGIAMDFQSFIEKIELQCRQIAREEAQKVFQENQELLAAKAAEDDAAAHSQPRLLGRNMYHSAQEIKFIISENAENLRQDLPSGSFAFKTFADALQKYTPIRPGDMQSTQKGIRWYGQVNNALNTWDFCSKQLGPCPIKKLYRGIYKWAED